MGMWIAALPGTIIGFQHIAAAGSVRKKAKFSKQRIRPPFEGGLILQIKHRHEKTVTP
jgi:hypothetical protein